ncbi:hypothetical protein G7B40_036235 [Aetokthonos hydrillicola Thurmond2011]|jgi:hypothetical protein|uniref:Low temperature-induced protein n=1 Tax=Aetokthonos hydrillicola Thurmond2011 TaxID=2712845 RepID=A0AAP5IE55_9CYAN|nr:hypothetical protein [Aetokthonos hydrillicola]MBO3457907.1 hypothetical protein [Aetokthonos hydrillicola CCALA 1050]MBW4587394.1 hypothetical protein [Aetokthonos hydrillicola CCALA 1050]MDR9899963.1 hypothetical protein [Aetokthonos hydrillicola Thurmond2011]
MLRPVRFLIAVFTCALLFFSSAFPAAAISGSQSNPEDATTQLLETQRLTDEVSAEPPLGLKQVQKRSNEGLNEVQGAADIDKMKRPENSQTATSAGETAKNLLDRVTGKK